MEGSGLVTTFADTEPVDGLLLWKDAQLSPVQRMAARGVIFERPCDAQTFWPDLFPSAEAATKAFRRHGTGTSAEVPDNPLYRSLIKDCPEPLDWRVNYQPAGNGRKPGVLHCTSTALNGLKAELTEKLGPLAMFEPTDVRSRAETARPDVVPPPPHGPPERTVRPDISLPQRQPQLITGIAIDRQLQGPALVCSAAALPQGEAAADEPQVTGVVVLGLQRLGIGTGHRSDLRQIIERRQRQDGRVGLVLAFCLTMFGSHA